MASKNRNRDESDTRDDQLDASYPPTDIDKFGETWSTSSSMLDEVGEGLAEPYGCQNKFSLVPRVARQFLSPKTLEVFTDDVFVVPPDGVEQLVEIQKLRVKGDHGFCHEEMILLKDLELHRIPLRPPTAFLDMCWKVMVKCLSKLSVRNFSIRYLPSEIGFLQKLEELDLSFNKLKTLPNGISQLCSLKLLRVSYNKLVDLPVSLSNLSQLEELDLSNNRLSSLEPINFASMLSLQILNIQDNMFLNCFQIPSRIFCQMKGDRNYSVRNADISLIEADDIDMDIHSNSGSQCSTSLYCSTSSLISEPMHGGRCHASQKILKGSKPRDSRQEIARQERLNYSRNCKGGHVHIEDKNMIMDECDSTDSLSMIGNEASEFQFHENEETLSDFSPKFCPFPGNQTASSQVISVDQLDQGEENNPEDLKSKNIKLNDSDCTSDHSYFTSQSSGINKPCENDSEVDNYDHSFYQTCQSEIFNENPCFESSKSSLKSKRHSDEFIDNPKPKKFKRHVDEHLDISFKYSSESLCGIDDHLPDGFYDAGRDRPFRPLQNYLEASCMDSREIILLDREKDEELGSIVLSAQILLSRLKGISGLTERKPLEVHDFQRASMLALFVSDCFGGRDRSFSLLRMRMGIVGSNKQQPFICTCSMNNYENKEVSHQTCGSKQSFSFADLCETSLRIIKETRNSSVVPLGSLRFGVCRHRAVLMKYLCDRMDPPIPCELVRGYLDFMPHAWNTILVWQEQSWLRMIVDTCYPTDIRDQNDPEYFCRYIPLCRNVTPLAIENPTFHGTSFPSLLLYPQETESTSHHSVRRCKFGNLDAAAKMKDLIFHGVSEEAAKIFEYTFLGEVRMLGALKNHSCIVEIYGHQLSSKWVAAADGNVEHRLLKSIIVMEYIKGGSLKSYMDKLSKGGEKHVPLDLALHIAREVACALVEVHSKKIIHRDVKSENILIDFDNMKVSGVPVVKLTDFDRAVPLRSFLHTCCIAHFGIHPPNVCVGTPRWMAPEVLQALHNRSLYGLEVDIWSYGCFLFELLTLQIPYEGLSNSELYDLLQMKQRPKLTPELEELASSNKYTGGHSLTGSYSDTDSRKLKFVIKLFYLCTSCDPDERPTARQIHEMLYDI